MALGKRKRDVAVVKRSADSQLDLDETTPTNDLESQKALRDYFEAHFEPLPDLALPQKGDDRGQSDQGVESDDETHMSEWDGISDDDSVLDTTVEVIQHEPAMASEDVGVDTAEFKKFMSTKLPVTTTSSARTTKSHSKTQPDEDIMDAANLKNDLDLQRLLQESSLLKKRKETGTREDRNRTTDLRLQSLGIKSSLFRQEKMPMSHRQGISAKQHSREELRRRDARENGIVLEKKTRSGDGGSVSKKKQAARQRGVDAPTVGRFRGGTLKLSGKDIADIQGPKRQVRGGRRR